MYSERINIRLWKMSVLRGPLTSFSKIHRKAFLRSFPEEDQDMRIKLWEIRKAELKNEL